MPHIRHQLQIHMDYFPDVEELLITYSYPFSGTHQLRPQKIHLSKDDIPVEIKTELNFLLEALSNRILPPTPVRLPHTSVMPSIRKAVATIVIQDQTQPYPIIRQYYLEKITEIGSQVERQIRMEPDNFSLDERESYERLRKQIKAIVWTDYKSLMGSLTFDKSG